MPVKLIEVLNPRLSVFQRRPNVKADNRGQTRAQKKEHRIIHFIFFSIALLNKDILSKNFWVSSFLAGTCPPAEILSLFSHYVLPFLSLSRLTAAFESNRILCTWNLTDDCATTFITFSNRRQLFLDNITPAHVRLHWIPAQLRFHRVIASVI